MSRNLRFLMFLVITVGLISTAFAGKPAPPPATCPTCEIVYALGGGSGRMDLMLMKKDGSSKTLLLAGDRQVAHDYPAWSPDGVWIAFFSNTGGEPALWIIRNDGTGLTKLVPACVPLLGLPSWRAVPANGGYWIAYQNQTVTSDSCFTASGDANIWAVKVSLGFAPAVIDGPLCLTCNLTDPPPYWEYNYWTRPSWLPDGMHLAATRFVETTSTVYEPYIFDVTFDAITGRPALGHAAAMNLPGDGRPIIWSSAHSHDWLAGRATLPTGYDVWKFDIDLLSEPETVLSWTSMTDGNTYYFNQFRWSCDDTKLVGVARVGKTSGIYTFAPGPPLSLQLLAPAGPNGIGWPDWRPVPCNP